MAQVVGAVPDDSLLDLLPSHLHQEVLHGVQFSARATSRAFRDALDAARFELHLRWPGDDVHGPPSAAAPAALAHVLARLPRLAALDASLAPGGALSAPGHDFLSSLALPTLTSLNLSHSPGVYTNFEPLTACLALRNLSLVCCGTIGDITPLGACVALERLDLSETSPSSLLPLAALPALRELRLTKSWSVFDDVSPLAACTSLTILDLRHTGAVNLDPLASCTRLASLHLNDCERIESLSPRSALTALSQLFLLNCPLITSIVPLAACPNLRHFAISGCRLVDITPLQTCQHLRTLKLSGCIGLTLITPLSACRELISLSLEGCAKVADLTPLAPLMALVKLDLDFCVGVTSSLAPLAACTALRQLNLLFCPAGADISPLQGMAGLTIRRRLDEVEEVVGLAL